MKKALIDSQTSVQHIISWTEDKAPQPVYETYPNSCRVCEVVDTPFEVCSTLFWVDCDDNVVADLYYYDSVAQTIKPVEDAQYPQQAVSTGPQPVSEGTQNL